MLFERLTGDLVSRGAPGEELPAGHDDIDIGGVELEPEANRPVISAAIKVLPEPRNGS